MGAKEEGKTHTNAALPGERRRLNPSRSPPPLPKSARKHPRKGGEQGAREVSGCFVRRRVAVVIAALQRTRSNRLPTMWDNINNKKAEKQPLVHTHTCAQREETVL